jgi:hypothetical protein
VYDDPYFYAYGHYPGYVGDRDDFTEYDEAVLAGGEAAERDVDVFEDDMGGT